MSDREKFIDTITKGYDFKGEYIVLGAGKLSDDVIQDAGVKVPLKTLNRHGLIAGATGTGKTKTLQVIAEGLSQKGVSVLLMDIKGDLSGLAEPGRENPVIESRHAAIGKPWKAMSFPVEFLTISGEKGARMRATVSEFGPILFSRILGLNDTQSGAVSLVFKYCDDKKLPLLDLDDFKKVLLYLTNEGKEEVKKTHGAVSTSSASTILRKVMELEQQGAAKIFGEMSFDVNDLVRIDEQGSGSISIFRLSDMPSKPKLFSTFMLCLLAEIYSTFPEEGDMDQPKLVIFVDEAHLVFKEATSAVQGQLETVIKLIRSKGVGIIFCTQNPIDIPAPVLSQLGLKIQHALRAFTASDRKAIRSAAENYPESDFYRTDELITSLGIGEALVTVLDEKGSPAPLVHTLICSPASRMDILTAAEIEIVVSRSRLAKKYNEEINRESAFEILTKKIEAAEETGRENKKFPEEETTVFEKVAGSTAGRQVMRTVARELTRGLLGVLGVKRSGTRKANPWF